MPWYNSVSGGRGGAPTRWRGGLQRSSIVHPASDAQWWHRCLRERASTFRALSTAVADGHTVFLEINCESCFSAWAAAMAQKGGFASSACGLAVLQQEGAATTDTGEEKSATGPCFVQVLCAVAKLWAEEGCDINWDAPAHACGCDHSALAAFYRDEQRCWPAVVTALGL